MCRGRRGGCSCSWRSSTIQCDEAAEIRSGVLVTSGVFGVYWGHRVYLSCACHVLTFSASFIPSFHKNTIFVVFFVRRAERSRTNRYAFTQADRRLKAAHGRLVCQHGVIIVDVYVRYA